MSDDPILVAIAQLRSDFLTELGETRAALMERLDRVRDDIGVNFGRADAVQRANEHTREDLRSLTEMVTTMVRRVRKQDERIEWLETKVREIRGDP
jgi:hypothetical protein